MGKQELAMVKNRKDEASALHANAMKHIDACLRSGVQITVLGMARDLDISTWIFYNVPHVKGYIQDAIKEQRSKGLPLFPTESASDVISVKSLRAENAMFRRKIEELEETLEKYRKRLQQQLGDEVALAPAAELLERIEELEEINERAMKDLDSRHTEVVALNLRIEDLSDEVAGLRHSQGIMMRQLSKAATDMPDK